MIKPINSFNGVVRFSFKDSIKLLEINKKRESLIFLHFSYGGGRFKYSTGYKSCFEDWDSEKQRIKETKSKIINSREVNEFLSKIESAIKKEFSRLQADQITVSNELLKMFLDTYLNKNLIVEKTKPITFSEFADAFLESKSKEISIITKRSYKQTLLKVKNYGLYNDAKVDFNSFDKEFVINFMNYLEEIDHSHNTISKHLKSLKTFLIEAQKKDYITNKNFRLSDFSLKPEETTAIYLTVQELKQMLEYDLSKKKDLELARDVFLIGCYTGQRVSDYNGLTENLIKKINGCDYFSIKQKKTKITVNCPITKEIREIMDKRHGGLPPKKILEKDLNKNIKTIGELLKWEDKIECSYKKGGKEHLESIPKFKLIYSHTARRSFCTNMYKIKMSVFDIMHFSGHKSEREFYKYIRIAGEERAAHIVGQGFFNI
jgi:integrase